MVKVEWDADCDGTYNYATTESKLLHTYGKFFFGKARVRITRESGEQATAEATVDVNAMGYSDIFQFFPRIANKQIRSLLYQLDCVEQTLTHRTHPDGWFVCVIFICDLPIHGRSILLDTSTKQVEMCWHMKVSCPLLGCIKHSSSWNTSLLKLLPLESGPRMKHTT